MSAQTCLPISSPFGAPAPAPGAARTSPSPGAAVQPETAVLPETHALAAVESAAAQAQSSSRGSIIGRLWRAYRQRRTEAVMRNLADEMDAHMLKDVGAPEWLVNEATHEQSMKRITCIDNLRW